ncbi:DJ-1/PfpI family protein, partial [Streptomyces torulosus]|uniref:DJ-1/PfpI family protein n=1 Tax=Streptomyces torulosus TaxID=68276 RepID=UPI000B32521D
MNKDAVGFVKASMNSGKPVATICHGPWTMVEADVVRGRRLTSWPSIRTHLRIAGAEVADKEIVIDGQFTSSRPRLARRRELRPRRLQAAATRPGAYCRAQGVQRHGPTCWGVQRGRPSVSAGRRFS